MYTIPLVLALAGVSCGQSYFQTSPEVLAGPTATGSAPFLAETNTVFFGTTFIPNTPLETAVPIANNPTNGNIFQLHGQLSSYFPNPQGFGAIEYPLPPGANITQLQMLHRHGSRYPTSDSGVSTFGQKIHNLTSNGTVTFNGSLAFLNHWSYNLGAEILVPRGRQELFDSGVLHYYNYAGLYDPKTKIVARATTQDRMLKSGEYFLAGFFGLEWTNNASLLPILETSTFTVNDTLAGYDNCPNSNNFLSTTGSNNSVIWENKYLVNATARLQKLTTGKYNWTIADAYNAQSLCAYETVAFGYSSFCDLFTYPEWQGYEYSVDVSFFGNNMFGSPTGRGVGIGYVSEVYARLLHHFPADAVGTTQINTTLDSQNLTFPLNQTLYFDFSHDTNIASILTAFGLTQFNQTLDGSGPPTNQSMIVSHMEPFGARLDIEVIRTPAPLKAQRPANISSASAADYYASGNTTQTGYVHFIMNQRTIPLGKSYPQCGQRDDGWCEMSTFLNVLSTKVAEAQYYTSCYGNYTAQNVTNGVPMHIP